MGKIEEFREARVDPLKQNELLFGWLEDDQARDELYKELRDKKFPILRFKSLLRSRNGNGEWVMDDVFLISRQDQIETALKGYSVQPYSQLASGGRFMLGLDEPSEHDPQRKVAAMSIAEGEGRAYQQSANEEEAKRPYKPEEIRACATAAFRRAAVRPLNRRVFDLSDLAEQAALNFMELLFGLPDEIHVALQVLMGGTYRGLVFAIIGRHFKSAADAQLGSPNSPRVVEFKRQLDKVIKEAFAAKGDAPFREGEPDVPVIRKLHLDPGDFDEEMQKVIVTGLIAGTIGNVRAAVPIAIHHFFACKDDRQQPLIDAARRAAHEKDPKRLADLIWDALLAHPPTPFLARTATRVVGDASPLKFIDEDDIEWPVPEGAHLLLAMGVAPTKELLFGGTYPEFRHQCVGQHLAWPLICEIVRQVLWLPGLSQMIASDVADKEDTGDPPDPPVKLGGKVAAEPGKPGKLLKEWGAMVMPYRLSYERGRRLNQQPLFVVLPIKPPVAENAQKLELLTKAGGYIVEQSLAQSGIVHFAWFAIVENGTHLALSTVYDGDFDAYVEHFASKVPLFDEQFRFLDVGDVYPITQHPKEFVEIIRKYNRAPLAKYFFSAYPTVPVAEVKNATKADHLAEFERTKGNRAETAKPGESDLTALPSGDVPEVQRLALTGYDFNCAVHLLLCVRTADCARKFLSDLLRRDGLAFGDRSRDRDFAIDVGFTYCGLEALELPDLYLQELAAKAPAFRQGALARAARRLGDSGASAAERWERVFQWGNAHVLISIHARTDDRAKEIAGELAKRDEALKGFSGWEEEHWLKAAHLTTNKDFRVAHFGLRDNIAKPRIAGAPGKGERDRHSAGELLLGHVNGAHFNLWQTDTRDEVARFFRNGSFAVLRKIEQDEERFNAFLADKADELLREAAFAGRDRRVIEQYLKAKFCGRWPNGARMKPGKNYEPPPPTPEELELDSGFDFHDDKDGFGCPFGSHIRRTNPRKDPVLPVRRRPLFRRGMPYGPLYHDEPAERRGLIGLFFCASIEDQFEHVMSEWVEKMPLGPASHGNAKDPLVGTHDDATSDFHIPCPDSDGNRLQEFKEPFVTTRGTLYTFFPSRAALCTIAGCAPGEVGSAQERFGAGR